MRTSLRPSAMVAVWATWRSEGLGVLRRFSAIERIALFAAAATPVALFLDYRVHLGLAHSISYQPIGEHKTSPAVYNEVFGLTQLLWFAAAAAIFALRPRREVVRSVTLLFLTAVLLLIPALTIVRTDIDSQTARSIVYEVIPYLAFVSVVVHPEISWHTRRSMVLLFAALVAVTVVASSGKALLATGTSQRLTSFVFGAPTDTGLALAALLVLVPAATGTIKLRVVIAVVLAGGLFLTQTRGALIAAIAGAAWYALERPRLRIPTVIVAACAILAYAVVFHRSLTFSDTGSLYRRENLSYHWQRFLHRPFGYGISRPSLPSVRAAHDTLLAVANAAGVIGLVAWVTAWAAPFVDRLRRRFASPEVAETAAAATLVAVLVGWVTTGSEVFIYSAPTNLLPLVLAVGLAGARPTL